MGENDEQERRDRQLSELTDEIRTVLTGSTVLFAFLLTVPTASGFDRLHGANRVAFFVAFLTTGAATVLLLAAAAYHRLIGHPYDKGRLVRTATRQVIAAFALLAVGLAAVTFFVTGLLYPQATAIAVSAALLALAVLTWFALPLARRRRE